jgi:transposase-like protein
MSCIRTRGKKSTPHLDPEDPPRRRANQQPGHGTYENDRPPIFSIVERGSGTVRYFVGDNADSSDCLNIIESTVPCGAAILYTDEWSGYRRVEDELEIRHATVRHGRDDEGSREWARDDDGDGQREVHCNTCEGAGTGLRTFLRTFRGVHKRYLKLYVATYEAMSNAKRITSTLIQRMCRPRELQTGYT